MISYWINEIEFSGGQRISLHPGSTTVVVGPNNSGKTSLLKELQLCTFGKSPGPVLKSAITEKIGTVDELKSWLDENTAVVLDRYKRQAYSWLGETCEAAAVPNLWNEPFVGDLSGLLCSLLSVDERLLHVQLPNPSESLTARFNTLKDPPQIPIHVLYKDERVEQRVSEMFSRAFGEDLVLNRGAGTDFPLHCGPRPQTKDGEDRISRNFVRRVSELPLLEKQGHGMRSFAGCALAMFASPALIHLVDEPEAFLHPAQARILGRLLITEKREWRQLFVATHSGDILRGILDAAPSDLNILRLTRSQTENHVKQLGIKEVQGLLSDPLLRYSNILDGLFHELVVVCESDADCRFYAAVLDSIWDHSKPFPDVHFVSSGGKHRIPTIVASLVPLGVPMLVVADFDILKDENPLRKIFESLGGQWEQIAEHWQNVKTAVEQKSPPLTRNQVRSGIESVLESSRSSNLSAEEVESIRQTLRRTSTWDTAKQVGVEVVPVGQPREQANALLTSLSSLGLFVVECGELERFVPTVGGHGPAWVIEVLKRDISRDPELANARQFVANLFSTAVAQPPTRDERQSIQLPTQTKSRMQRMGTVYHLREAIKHLFRAFLFWK